MANTIQKLSPQVRQRLVEMSRTRAKSITLYENAWFIDAVGTFVSGASYLLGGAPGSRKSGMATQIALDLARQGRRVLLIPTEEPFDRVYERLIRMMGDDSAANIDRSLANFLIERNPPSIEMLTVHCGASPCITYNMSANFRTKRSISSIVL